MSHTFRPAALALAIAIFATAGVVTVSTSTATAQTVKQTKSRFYEFSTLTIAGGVKKPATIWMESRKRVMFKPILKLKKSFRQAMVDTRNEPILR